MEQRRKSPQYAADLLSMQEVMGRAMRRAITRHKRLGESVAAWQDDEVVVLSAQAIPTSGKLGKRGVT
jgi:hypothetical protein